MSASLFLQMLIQGLIVGSVYGLVALGYVTIYQCSGVVNIAQGDFVMLGALITMHFLNLHLPYFVAAAAGVVSTALIGLLLYELVVGRLLKASPIMMVMATLGISMLIEGVTFIFWGGFPQALPPFTGTAPLRFGAFSIAPQGALIILMAAVVLVVLYMVNNRTVFGKRMTATSTQPLAASLVGIPRVAMIRWSFIISSAVGAVAGVFLAAMLPMDFGSGMNYGLMGFVASAVGGWGKSTGAMAGGVLVGILATFSALFFPTGYEQAVAYIMLILVLYFRPEGILGSSLVEEL